MAGIKSDIVYHAGRHSFASLITLGEGVPIETISRMLGHTNIQTTQIYARVTQNKLFEDMDKRWFNFQLVFRFRHSPVS